jgi:hypothetical protein
MADVAARELMAMLVVRKSRRLFAVAWRVVLERPSLEGANASVMYGLAKTVITTNDDTFFIFAIRGLEWASDKDTGSDLATGV